MHLQSPPLSNRAALHNYASSEVALRRMHIRILRLLEQKIAEEFKVKLNLMITSLVWRMVAYYSHFPMAYT
jgi:hypothetical protein